MKVVLIETIVEFLMKSRYAWVYDVQVCYQR